jgi:hypothetical protein
MSQVRFLRFQRCALYEYVNPPTDVFSLRCLVFAFQSILEVIVVL